MHLGYVILYVPDVEGAMAFYERAFGLDRRFVHESGDYGELATGATVLAFAADDLAASNFAVDYRRADPTARPSAFEVAFVTDDVGAAFERAVDAGAAVLSVPTQKPWGQTVAYVRDGNGVIVELCSPAGS
ncbi:MAG: VOC family protein [Bacteroidota bacterium]